MSSTASFWTERWDKYRRLGRQVTPQAPAGDGAANCSGVHVLELSGKGFGIRDEDQGAQGAFATKSRLPIRPPNVLTETFLQRVGPSSRTGRPVCAT